MTMANIKTFACINRRTNAKVLANSLALSTSLSLSPFSSLPLLHSSLPSFPPFILGEELSEISTTNERTSRSRPNKIHFSKGEKAIIGRRLADVETELCSDWLRDPNLGRVRFLLRPFSLRAGSAQFYVGFHKG